MRPILVFAVLILAAAFLGGCGEPATSTTLAPEQKLPDVSKMSPEQIDQMLKKDKAGDRK